MRGEPVKLKYNRPLQPVEIIDNSFHTCFGIFGQQDNVRPRRLGMPDQPAAPAVRPARKHERKHSREVAARVDGKRQRRMLPAEMFPPDGQKVRIGKGSVTAARAQSSPIVDKMPVILVREVRPPDFNRYSALGFHPAFTARLFVPEHIKQKKRIDRELQTGCDKKAQRRTVQAEPRNQNRIDAEPCQQHKTVSERLQPELPRGSNRILNRFADIGHGRRRHDKHEQRLIGRVLPRIQERKNISAEKGCGQYHRDSQDAGQNNHVAQDSDKTPGISLSEQFCQTRIARLAERAYGHAADVHDVYSRRVVSERSGPEIAVDKINR